MADALIVAHGQPSDPGPAGKDLARLADQVRALVPGWRIASATLAEPGALAAALSGLERPVVLPFFMSDGWFTRSELPRRLAEAGAADLTIRLAFGLAPAIAPLAARLARFAAEARGWAPADTRLVLAAHGSGRSRASALATADLARLITDFASVTMGFIEEAPFLADAARGAGTRAICLPLFVARWGHVVTDVPEALQQAGFTGALLDPIGCAPDVPAILASLLQGGTEP